MDLQALKVIVFDECDFFFGDDVNFGIVKSIAQNKVVQ